tara:strand:+ start:164 stop:595 length:432 start_codon:yes stop_codon:yes gene_type:complete
MINYARHDEEFYGVFKLVSGDEVLGKAVLTEDNGQTLVFIQEPVCTQIITKETDDGRTVRGIGFAKWMQFSSEDFFILTEKDIITVTSMSKEVTIMYEAYIMSEDEDRRDEKKIELQEEMGYLGKIDQARKNLENIFRGPSHQ